MSLMQGVLHHWTAPIWGGQCKSQLCISPCNVFACFRLSWFLLSFLLSLIHFPNRKMDEPASPQPQLIFFRVGLLSLPINMHDSYWVLVLNGLDPCVYVWASVFPCSNSWVKVLLRLWRCVTYLYVRMSKLRGSGLRFSGSLAAAGELKCHNRLLTAFLANAACGWLVLNLA